MVSYYKCILKLDTNEYLIINNKYEIEIIVLGIMISITLADIKQLLVATFSVLCLPQAEFLNVTQSCSS